MSNSPLATYRRITNHKNSPRRHKIDTITIHCMAGQMSGRACADYFATTTRQVSANYCIGYDGDIAISVDEADRSWCSSSPSNDHRAITIEVATDKDKPWPCTQKAYNALLDLVEDICRRNGIEKLRFTGDTNGNMTMHKWFTATACPGDYLAERFSDIEKEVNRRLAGETKPSDDNIEGKNYLTYPCKTMNITQGYNGNYSHASHSQGIPWDYPIDDACSDGGREYFYCPCDEMRIAHIYGVGNSNKTNSIWLESTTKVKMPYGEDYVTIQVIHPNDDTLGKLNVGQVFRRGQTMFLEGNDGNATGYHFHISVAAGKFTGSGWVQNSRGAWVISSTGKALKPEEAFYLNPAFTTVKNNAGLRFDKIPQAPVKMLYRVQIGAFSSKENAENYAKKARAAGFPTVIKEETDNGKTLYRVQCGAFSKRENAENFAKDLKKAGFDVIMKEAEQ